MRARRILAIGAAGLIGLLAILFAALQTPPGQRAVAGLVSRMASGPDGGLGISGLSGFFPTDLHVARISYSDREGPWLTVENARLRWSFTSLLGGRLRVELISADRVAVLRPPLPGKEESKDESGGGVRLPVGIDVNALEIGDLHLAAALARVDSHWKLSGHAVLPADLAQGRLILTGDRIDGPNGRLSADIGFDVEKRTVDGEVSLSEKRGGLIAALLERPDIEELSMRLVARGDARAGNAELVVAAGEAARANGKATWGPDGAATVVSVQLDTAGPGLPQGRVADVMREPIALTARAVVDDQIATLNELKLNAGTLGVEASARYDRDGRPPRGQSSRCGLPSRARLPRSLAARRGAACASRRRPISAPCRPGRRVRSRSPAAPTTSRLPPWTSGCQRLAPSRWPAISALALTARSPPGRSMSDRHSPR